jgi:hypothetical protein
MKVHSSMKTAGATMKVGPISMTVMISAPPMWVAAMISEPPTRGQPTVMSLAMEVPVPSSAAAPMTTAAMAPVVAPANVDASQGPTNAKPGARAIPTAAVTTHASKAGAEAHLPVAAWTAVDLLTPTTAVEMMAAAALPLIPA